MLAQQAQLVDAFSRALRAAGHRVQRFETHVSWIVVAGDEVLWVPGYAVAERLRIGPATSEVVLMTADRSDSTAAP